VKKTDLISPRPYLRRLGGILPACNFNACLYFAERDGGKIEIGIGNAKSARAQWFPRRVGSLPAAPCLHTH